MAKVGKWTCSKCGSEDYKVEELMMTGRHGVIGGGYRFKRLYMPKVWLFGALF